MIPCIAATESIDLGRYMPTRSPGTTPSPISFRADPACELMQLAVRDALVPVLDRDLVGPLRGGALQECVKAGHVASPLLLGFDELFDRREGADVLFIQLVRFHLDAEFLLEERGQPAASPANRGFRS